MKSTPSAGSPLYPRIRFAFTDHPITVWAGAMLLRLYFELIGLRVALVPILPALSKHSNNQIPATDVLLAWFDGLALGAERCAHFTRYPGSTAAPVTIADFYCEIRDKKRLSEESRLGEKTIFSRFT